MRKIISRKEEKQLLKNALNSKIPELVVIYGYPSSHLPQDFLLKNRNVQLVRTLLLNFQEDF